MTPVLTPEVIITRTSGIEDPRSIVTLNAHALDQVCAVRVVGGACDVRGSEHEWLSMHATQQVDSQFKEPVHHSWVLTKCSKGFQLADARGILNVFEFVPLTGVVAVQLVLSWGAVKCILRDMSMNYKKDVIGPHDIKANRAFMKTLEDEGHVEHWR